MPNPDGPSRRGTRRSGTAGLPPLTVVSSTVPSFFRLKASLSTRPPTHEAADIHMAPTIEKNAILPINDRLGPVSFCPCKSIVLSGVGLAELESNGTRPAGAREPFPFLCG